MRAALRRLVNLGLLDRKYARHAGLRMTYVRPCHDAIRRARQGCLQHDGEDTEAGDTP